MMKNAFYLILKALFILKIFNFCVNFLALQKKRFNIKIYDVTAWLTNSYITRIACITLQ